MARLRLGKVKDGELSEWVIAAFMTVTHRAMLCHAVYYMTTIHARGYILLPHVASGV